MAKHSAPYTSLEEVGTKKCRKDRGTTVTTPQRTSDADEAQQQQQAQGQQTGASSSGHQAVQTPPGARTKRIRKGHKSRTSSLTQGTAGAQQCTLQAPLPIQQHPDLQEQHAGAATSGSQLATTHQLSGPLQDTMHTAALNQAVLEAVNRLISQNWDLSLAVATQALHNLNISAALHILGTITTTAPDDINSWIRGRAMAALINQQQEGLATPDAASMTPATQSPQPTRLSPLQISKQVAFFGRYPRTRPFGMLADADGRLSLHNLMLTWGTPQGLSTAHVKAVLQQHGTSRKGQRFITTAVHDDLMIAVSRPTPHPAYTATRHPRAIGAPRSPKHRSHR